MKILHLCPLWFPISRDTPGGIETFLAQLLPAMQAFGCESTIIASSDSRTSAELLPVVEHGLYEMMKAGAAAEYAYYEQRQLRLALEAARRFDIVHSHVGAGAYVLSALPEHRQRVLHTVHWPVHADHQWFVRHHPRYWYSTVSEHQARKLRSAGATQCRAIHNGIDFTRFAFAPHAGEGLLFIGRMEATKGVDMAIRVARDLDRPLTIAGPVVEKEFFDRRVVPYLDERIRYIGVVDHDRKNQLFGEAACAILPFRGEEPFGLVAIEAMACGTPVVASANGALPEIVEPGATGFLAGKLEDLAPLVRRASQLDRAVVRARGAARFDISVVAARYDELYRHMVDSSASGGNSKGCEACL
jgi:glycosyltransferase involved in cell wall biosynthesis